MHLMSRHYPFRSTNLARASLPSILSQIDQAFEMIDPSIWSPRVDIQENEGSFSIQVDLPGVGPDDIDIQTDKQVLSIQGKRTLERKEEEGASLRTERFSGEFLRRFSLPESADLESIEASYENGVLEVVIPKRAEEKPRRIQVKTVQANEGSGNGQGDVVGQDQA